MNKINLFLFVVFASLTSAANALAVLSTDRTRPTVSITSPTSYQEVLIGDVMSLSANASDNVAVAGVQFSIDGVNYGAKDTVAPYALTWESAGARVGTHYVRAVVCDTSNNTTYSSVVYFKVKGLSVDRTRPTVSITSPTSNQTVLIGDALNLSAKASDNVAVAGVQFSIDGVNYGAEDTVAPYALNWESAGARVGMHYIRAVARDTSNNTTYSSVYFKVKGLSVDSTRPTVSITSPTSNQTVLIGDALNLSAKASDNVAVAGVQFSIDGVNYGAEDTVAPYALNWESAGARVGMHYVRAVARDTSNNTTYSSVYFKVKGLSVDSTRPTVSITSPTSNQTVLIGDVISLSANASDNVAVAGVQFSIDGVNYGAEDTVAPYGIDWNSAGATSGFHTVRAVARDAAGNKATSVSISFQARTAEKPDTTAPAVQITSPVAGSKLSGTVNFSASATDPQVSGATTSGVKQVQFLIDGTVVGTTATTPYQLSYNTNALSSGTHSIVARATDNAGNAGNSPAIGFSVEATIKPDTTVPDVLVTSPIAGSELSDTISISASATDPVVSGANTSGIKQVQFLIDGAPVGTTTAAPYLVSYDTNALSNGSHTIAARATDNAGNTGNSPAISVTVSNQVNTQNLVPNPSLEVADSVDPSSPANWMFKSWSTSGISAISTYPVAGFHGTKAAKVEITAYTTDGDAKWYFDPQPVTAGTRYNVSDNFKSNIPSRVMASFTLSNGTNNDIELSPASAAANWTAYSDFVTAPAGAVKMSVFHLIDRVGWLQTDNYSVTVVTVSANLLFNGDLEIPSLSDPALPSHWYQGAWGANARAFSYASGLGRSGSRGAKISITSYTDGDARWYTDDLPVVPGEYYKFFDWYKSSIDTRVVAHFVYTDNTDHYVDLRVASAASDWTAYSDYVQIPANAKTMSVYQLITGVGWLITDDYSLQKTTISGFNHPLVTLSFDDGWEDNVGNVLPVLNSSGFKANFYFSTQYIEGNGSDIPASPAGVAAVKTIFNGGNEVGSHGVAHPFLTTATAPNLNYELSHSKAYLENIVGLGNIKSFATPYGAYNQTVLTAIKSYYQSHRTVDTGYNLPDGFDPYRIKVQNMLVGTTLAEYQGWLNEAKNNNLWLVLVYHRVGTAGLGPYDTKVADFTPQMEFIKNSGIPVKTMSEALTDLAQ